MSITQTEKGIPLIDVSIEKKELSPERKAELDKATRERREEKKELIFNNAILVSKLGKKDYKRFKEEDGEPAVGIYLRYSDSKGMVIDFTDPGIVLLKDVEELYTEGVYWLTGDTTVTTNNNDKSMVQRRFLMKGSAEKVKIRILVSELLTLSWLSYLIMTGNRTPEIQAQIEAVEQWVGDRKLIITSTTTPYSMYGLKIMRGKERRKRV